VNHHELDQYLLKYNPIEVRQLETNCNIRELGGNELDIPDSELLPRLHDHFFFDRGPIFISKHHRFAEMPLHMHSFIEINYVYSGNCVQQINGEEVVLRQGQLCLLDTDVPHSIGRLGEEDILINIIMTKKTLTSAFFTRLGSSGVVTDFLLNAISADTTHNRYLVFHSEHHENLRHTIKNMMCEFFDPREYSTEMINSYMLIVLTELMRVYRHDSNFNPSSKNKRTELLDILQYIEQNYNNCTLRSLAAQFNYNSNYLGNFLKKNTGKTFLELIQDQRMNMAAAMLAHTDRNTQDIALEVGYDSLSFFYKKFAEHFACTPHQYREQHSKSLNL
jgi:AraC-like DNA-binding protein/mannose-6-phosphate isomerase-like protein (cupin superfamily)